MPKTRNQLRRSERFGLGAIILLGLLNCAAGIDVDSGYDARGLVQALAESSAQSANGEELFTGGWVRIRGVVEAKAEGKEQGIAPGKPETGNLKAEIEQTRQALGHLRERGLKTCVTLRWPEADWKRKYLPDDLREAYARGRFLGVTYGDLVDAWETDNEPDLGFVPENPERYAGYLKAMYLGIRRGFEEAKEKPETGDLKPEVSDPPQVLGFKSQVSTQAPLVLMASLGMPPGPWLERFAANDGFAYTDGYNYHYYGYADDFTAYYRLHEAAVAALSAAEAKEKPETGDLKPEGSGNNSGLRSQVSGLSLSPQVSTNLRQKSFPIFLTELGYGMLGKAARDTKEGRLRQWRWFKSVGGQTVALRIEAPMTFYLRPYLEYDALEYGMTVAERRKTEDGGRSTVAEGRTENGGQGTQRKPEDVPLLAAANPVFVPDSRFPKSGQRDLKPEDESPVWIAGGIEYVPEDFSAPASHPVTDNSHPITNTPQVSGLRLQVSPIDSWTQLIGQKIGGNEITPALAAWMTERAKGREQSAKSKEWTMNVPAASPVVIDFLPGDGLSSVKRFNGHFVVGKSPPVESKSAEEKPASVTPPSAPAPTPREEMLIQIRTADDNLFEVYPLRQVEAGWQSYLEEHGNFTLSPYCRAAAGWRFGSARPVSLAISVSPKKLPAVIEFRRVQLLKLAGANRSAATPFRFGAGKVVLYNFSERAVAGRLTLPELMAGEAGAHQPVRLEPGERREIPVQIKFPADAYRRENVSVVFEAEDEAVPPARLVTDLLPGVDHMRATTVVPLLDQGPGQTKVAQNAAFLRARQTVEEEVPKRESSSGSEVPQATNMTPLLFFTNNPGNRLDRTSDGFTLTMEKREDNKPGGIAVEIPWPDDVEFSPDFFLSMEFRLRSELP